MTELRDPLICFNDLKEKILAIPDDKKVALNMPLEEAMQEGTRVSALVDKYYKELSKSDIDMEHLDSVSTRSGAFAYCVAVNESVVNNGVNNIKTYQLLKKEGYKLRSKILKDYDYVFRKNPDVLSAVENIRLGRGDLDMIRDLLSSYNLGIKYKEKLQKANFELSQLEKADSLYKELSSLSANIDIDPEKMGETKIMCAKAWTYLWEALDEIYKAGRFVFSQQPEIEELFYIDYRQELARKRSEHPEDKEPELEPAVQ